MTAAPKHTTAGRRVRAKIVEIFGADLRPLAVFRVVLALLVLADLANRATDLYQQLHRRRGLASHRSHEGSAEPLGVLVEPHAREPYFQALLFGVAALAAVGMLAGYRTRRPRGRVGPQPYWLTRREAPC